VPAIAVIRRGRVLLFMTGRKGRIGGLLCEKKSLNNANLKIFFKQINLSLIEVGCTSSGEVKFLDIVKAINRWKRPAILNWH